MGPSSILPTILIIVSIAPASLGAVYEKTLDVYTYSVGGTINWSHTYDHSADPISYATLTIVADDVDGPGDGTDGKHDAVYFAGHYLGLLEDMGYYTNWNYSPGPGNPGQPLTTTVFTLDPSWLNGLPVAVQVEAGWGVEIETSTLTVVPEPTTLSLLALGGLAVVTRPKRG